MTITRLTALCTLAILALAAISSAQTYETRPYKIQRGDTLWSIAAKEMKDPFQWPLIWRENPSIKNPDRLTPGQDLMLPLLIVPQATEETTPESGQEAIKTVSAPNPAPPAASNAESPAVSNAAAPAVSNAESPALSNAASPAVSNAEAAERSAPSKTNSPFTGYEILQAGYMTRKVPAAGKIYAPVFATGHELITKGYEVYLKTKRPAAVGDKFIVIRAEKIDHPVTGESLGYLIDPLGVLQVKSFEDKLARAVVMDAFEGIARGDIIIKYTEPEIQPVPENNKPSVNGYVVAIKKLRLEAGGSDIVYLDKGRADGLEFGDLVATMKGPDKNATLQIIRAEAHSSAAVVKESSMPVTAGDPFTGME